MPSIAAVQPLHVGAWIEWQTQGHAAPTVKQRLAALLHLFDWLVTGQVMPVNPAASVRGSAHAVNAGKERIVKLSQACPPGNTAELCTAAIAVELAAKAGKGNGAGGETTGSKPAGGTVGRR